MVWIGFNMGKIFDSQEPGGGGGSLPLEVVPDARESPSEKHPKRGFHGMPKDTLNRSHGTISTS